MDGHRRGDRRGDRSVPHPDHRLDIEMDGRKFTGEMPGMYKAGLESEFTVTDTATGERIVEGRRITEGETRSLSRRSGRSRSPRGPNWHGCTRPNLLCWGSTTHRALP
jgi:hypothetical protein